MIQCRHAPMAQRPFPPHWYQRWWLVPGEPVWHGVIDGSRWKVILDRVTPSSWEFAVVRDRQLVEAALEWDPIAKEILGVPVGAIEAPLPRALITSLEENLRERSRGIRVLSDAELDVLRHTVSALGEAEWISGRKLRRKLGIEDLSQFQNRITDLVPRYLRADLVNVGDLYSPTLPGLLQAIDERSQRVLGHLIAALTRRYDLDPDARSYDWEDLAAVGMAEADVQLAYSVASITQLQSGGHMVSPATPPRISLGMPRDAEQIVIACRIKSLSNYLIEAANRRPDQWLSGEPHDRPWPSAPAVIESDYFDVEVPQFSTSGVQVLAPRDQEPFHLHSLSLVEIGGIQDLQIPFTPPPADSGQWVIFLGANGSGKTSILRAITLALCSNEVISAVLGRLGTSVPIVRVGSKNATVQLGPRAGRVPRLQLNATPTGDSLGDRGSGDIIYPFVVAYGCRRGTALGGAKREVNTPSLLSDVETLFNEGAGLVHAETWLKERKLATFDQDGTGKAIYQCIEATLIGLLPEIEAIYVTADRVEVQGKAMGRIPFGALSDGYLTTAGWALDLIARWVEDAKLRGTPLDGSFTSRMTGVVILDELDLHLHPQWQRDVIKHVRRHFPRMTFVVTTHNPLTLLGAGPGEIYVLGRNAEGKVTAVQRDLPPGASAEHILTGEWFGLASTLDDATLDLLDQHRRLLRDGKADTREAKDLERTLATRLGSFASTSLERLAHSAAAQILDDEARQLSAAERKAALAKIVEIMRGGNPSQS